MRMAWRRGEKTAGADGAGGNARRCWGRRGVNVRVGGSAVATRARVKWSELRDDAIQYLSSWPIFASDYERVGLCAQF